MVQSRNYLQAETIAVQWTNITFHPLKISEHLLDRIFDCEMSVWK